MARVGMPIQRRWPLVVIGIVVAAAIVFTIMSSFYIDVLWYREVELSSVFWKVVRTKFLLGLVGAAFFFAVLYANITIARRLAPKTRVIAPDQEVVERFRLGLEPYLWWLLPVGVGVLALFTGIGVSRQWQSFLLWQNSGGLSFGAKDPQFHRDAAFYVFSLPVLRFIQGLLFSVLVTVTIITAGAHVLWGGIRPQAVALADKVAPAVRAHLSVLLAAIMVAKAWGYYLGRFTLVTSERGVVEGASYTDVKAQLPALTFLTIAAIGCAVLFLVNIRLRNWALPVIAVVILGGVSVLIGTAYPAFVQNFSVKPQEQQREAPYIGYNIEGTRAAFGLDTVTSSQRPVTTTLTTDDLDENQATVSNIRLWRPSILREDLQSLQRFKQFYEFEDVDVDRYDVSGQRRVLMLSGREVSQDQIPQGGQTWQNAHLVYTHGFGAVAAQVNSATPEGQPEFTLQDIPPQGVPTLEQPRIYYGESDKVPFVLVGTQTDELDYQGSPDPQNYQGEGGIPIGNIFQRALFAWRFRDVNLLISGQITGDSKILIRRDLESRVTAAAPFLHFDRDPYLAIVDGRLVWILDAYTSTDQYPYSQEVDASQVIVGTGALNYIRNSVKVTVDAYDGTMRYIVVDDTDPIIQAWAKAFPEMFTPGADAPADLQAHYRYPEGLFTIQAFQYANYHVTDPAVFYQKTNRWEVPQDPTFCANDRANPACAEGAVGGIPSMSPSYVLMKLPGEEDEQFVLIMPFVPQGRQNMVGWMAAKSDPGSYGEIVAYEFPQDRTIDGPSLAFSRMNQDRTFSSERSLLAQQGSDVLFGDFLVIPINDSFLYVQPVYVRSVGENAIPELKRVLVLNGQASGVGLADNLADALDIAVGAGGGPTPPPTGSVDQQIQDLLAEALDHFQAADDALTAGNLATYQSELTQAQALVQQANDLAEQAAQGSGTSPSPSVTPSPSG